MRTREENSKTNC